MHSPHAIDEEPLPGYRLLEPLGEGGFGQVWKCEAPGGLVKAMKFVRSGGLGHDADAAEQELRSLQRVKSIRHPFLLSLERVERVGDDLVVVTELADRSLHDLLQQYQSEGRPGVPRAEALAYLREAAEVLDLMNREHGLQHLDVKPRNLFLVGRHVKVADFGLVNSLADLSAGRPDLLGAITPLYASPETYEGRVSSSSDQYSLAVTYQELVSGTLPFSGRNVRQLMLNVMGGRPDLSALAEADRQAVARALSRAPDARHDSCEAFVEALELADPDDAPRRPKAKTTSFEILLGDTANANDGSGLFRRRSRVLQAVRPSAAAASADALGGYKLMESLSRGSLGELWRAAGPTGEPCLVRFLTLPESAFANDALGRLTSLAHPVLPVPRLIEAGPGRVALITSAGDSSLAGRLKECQTAGMPGIPRHELLPWLAHFAHALDELYHHHQVQHLALTPRHLALCRGAPLLLEFGLAELLMLPQGVQPASLNPRYAAVELLDGMVSDACDQYSLALIYQELLVGLHPFRGLNTRQLTSSKARSQPELSLLPAPDRAVVSQALASDPQRRFRSCREFVLALEQTSGKRPSAARPRAAEPPPSEWESAVAEIVEGSARGHLVETEGQAHYRLTPGVEAEHHGSMRLVAGLLSMKLGGFCEPFKATVAARGERRWEVTIPAKGSLMQRCLGRVPSLLVELTAGRAAEASAGGMTPLRVRMQPRDCGRDRADRLLAELAPAVLAAARAHFQAAGDRQAQERFPLAQGVHVEAADGTAVTGRTRDVGRAEMALFAPCPLPLGPVRLTLNRWASPLTVTVPGRVRDCRDAGGGEYEAAVVLG